MNFKAHSIDVINNGGHLDVLELLNSQVIHLLNFKRL